MKKKTLSVAPRPEDLNSHGVLVQVRDLNKTFTDCVDEHGIKTNLRALQGVSFDIHPGEFIAVTGNNGSGKSTLVNCLGAFETSDTPDTQPIQYFNDIGFCDIWQDPEWYRQNFVGIVFQEFHLLPTLNVEQNVEFPLHLRQCRRYSESATDRRMLTHEALGRVGMLDKKNSKVSKISGGQRQKAAIARALVKEPRLLLADEPTGNLDKRSKIEIVEILRGLASGNLSVLMVTHDLELARDADRIIHLDYGQIASQDVRNLPRRAPVAPPNAEQTPSIAQMVRTRNPLELASPATDQRDRLEPSEPAAAADTTTPSDRVANADPAARIAQLEAKISGVHGVDPPRPSALSKVSPHPEETGITEPFLGEALGANPVEGARGLAPPEPKRTRGKAFMGTSQSLPDLIRYSMRDARESKISLASNIFAILLGTFLTAMLLALLGGTEKYIQHKLDTIPSIDSVRVWIDYSTGEMPLTAPEVKRLSNWPGAKMTIASINQAVPLFQKATREVIANLFSTQNGDPEVMRLPIAAGSREVNPDKWDVILPMRVAEEISNFNPLGLVGATITLQLRSYSKSADVQGAKPAETFDYPVRIVGILKESPEDRVYGSLNMVRFVRDFSTGRSDYMAAPGEAIDSQKISARTLNENLRIHFGGPADAERVSLDMKRDVKRRFEVSWPGEDMQVLRDLQTISTIVLIGIGLMAVVAGAVSIFNTLLASVARKTKEIGIMRALGVASSDVFLIFLSQSVIIGVLACLVGLVTAMAVTGPLNGFVSGRWGQLKEDMTLIGGLFQISALMVVSLVVVVLAICLLAAFLPALRAARKTPMDALQGH